MIQWLGTYSGYSFAVYHCSKENPVDMKQTVKNFQVVSKSKIHYSSKNYIPSPPPTNFPENLPLEIRDGVVGHWKDYIHNKEIDISSNGTVLDLSLQGRHLSGNMNETKGTHQNVTFYGNNGENITIPICAQDTKSRHFGIAIEGRVYLPVPAS